MGARRARLPGRGLPFFIASEKSEFPAPAGSGNDPFMPAVRRRSPGFHRAARGCPGHGLSRADAARSADAVFPLACLRCRIMPARSCRRVHADVERGARGFCSARGHGGARWRLPLGRLLPHGKRWPGTGAWSGCPQARQKTGRARGSFSVFPGNWRGRPFPCVKPAWGPAPWQGPGGPSPGVGGHGDVDGSAKGLREPARVSGERGFHGLAAPYPHGSPFTQGRSEGSSRGNNGEGDARGKGAFRGAVGSLRLARAWACPRVHVDGRHGRPDGWPGDVPVGLAMGELPGALSLSNTALALQRLSADYVLCSIF